MPLLGPGPTQDTTLPLVVMSQEAPLGCDSLSDLSLDLMTLAVCWRPEQLSCGLLGAVLMVRLGSWVLRRKTPKVKWPAHPIMSITPSFTLITESHSEDSMICLHHV